MSQSVSSAKSSINEVYENLSQKYLEQMKNSSNIAHS